MGLSFRIAQFFHQRILDLLDQLVRKIAVRGRSRFPGHNIDVLNTRIHIVGKRFLLSCLVDQSLIHHILKDDLSFLSIVLRMRDGIKTGRTLGNTSQNRGLG